MLNDEERWAFNTAWEAWCSQRNLDQKTHDMQLAYMFAAGIAYAQKWRSMESAPKDGTAILLGNAGGSWIARYEPVYQSGYRPENPWFSLMLNRDYMKRNYAPPTHWMPLPLPPTEVK